jgi:hypothetical protein
LAFSDTIIFWLLASWVYPAVVIFVGASVWLLIRVSTMNSYLREIRDMMKDKEKLEPKTA